MSETKEVLEDIIESIQTGINDLQTLEMKQRLGKNLNSEKVAEVKLAIICLTNMQEMAYKEIENIRDHE